MKRAKNPSPVRCTSTLPQHQGRTFDMHLYGHENSCTRCGTSKQAVAHAAARAKCTRIDVDGKIHFALIKRDDFEAQSGRLLDALTAAKKLLDCGSWPLWEKTPSRVVVGVDDRVCVYLSGVGTVVATARIAKIEPWSRTHQSSYPLYLGGSPSQVLRLADVQMLPQPVAVGSLVDHLDCVGQNKRKWGSAFCGGMRTLSPHDYRLLTGKG